MKILYAATIHFSRSPVYNVTPLTKILESVDIPFFNETESQVSFINTATNLYIPTLKFLLSQDIKCNLIFTGDFLEYSQIHQPEIINLILQLIDKKIIKIVADAFYGESTSCIYNASWWSESIHKTMNSAEKILGIKPKNIFLPQLFRSLELERVFDKQRKYTFVLRQKGKKYSNFSMKLSELRRFNGNYVSWITGDNDFECDFRFIPDTDYFFANGNLFQPNLEKAAKSFALAAGFVASDYDVKKDTKKIRTFLQTPRITEYPSLGFYSSMEKATLRLWEYGLILITNKLHHKPTLELIKLSEDFGLLQNSLFFFYLNKSIYLSGKVTNFSSPYEAFVSMQVRIKQVEILLDKKEEESDISDNNDKKTVRG